MPLTPFPHRPEYHRAPPHLLLAVGEGIILLCLALMVAAGCTAPRPAERAEQQQGAGQHLVQDERARGAAEAKDDGTQLIFLQLPTNFAPVQVSQQELYSAVTELMLNVPLRLGQGERLYPGRAVAQVSLLAPEWQSSLARDYKLLCERRKTPGDCLSFFEDGPVIQNDDKLRLGLSLAVGPLLQGMGDELKAMVSPERLIPMVSITATVCLALMVSPDPLSKGVAAVMAVLMWGYLGWELWDLLKGWSAFTRETAQARTYMEIYEASDRFGKKVGPNVIRLVILAATAALGQGALAARAKNMANYEQAGRMAEAGAGVKLAEAAEGAEKVIVSVEEGTLRVVLPENALAMVGKAGRGGRGGGRMLPNGHRAFDSFDSFKEALGKAGQDMEWHHIVEQHAHNLARFGAEALHNTENVIRLAVELHRRLNRIYSSKNFSITRSRDLTVREWLRTQSYEAQRAFGLQALENVRKGVW